MDLDVRVDSELTPSYTKTIVSSRVNIELPKSKKDGQSTSDMSKRTPTEVEEQYTVGLYPSETIPENEEVSVDSSLIEVVLSTILEYIGH